MWQWPDIWTVYWEPVPKQIVMPMTPKVTDAGPADAVAPVDVINPRRRYESKREALIKGFLFVLMQGRDALR